ncbi:MAG: hypothetical protein K1X74_01245 [Pirellulales bacterium]|nr:hypothetical protein [Pirellulales bacterium]
MLNKLTRSLFTLFLMLMALGTYRLLAVPLIEPPAERRATTHHVSDPKWHEKVRARQRKGLSALFPEGAWQLEAPFVLETDRAKLIFREYENLPDGRISINPCTMIFVPNDAELTDDERRQRAMVLEAPQGAKLRFDKPLDLRKTSFGRLIASELAGPLTLRSAGREPGPEDDLYIETSDLMINEVDGTTPQPIVFRQGGNAGQGVGLRIEFVSTVPSATAHKQSVSGIKSLSILRDITLELLIDTGSALPADRGSAPQPTGERQLAPLRIRCVGPLEYDALRYALSFQQRVEVTRVNPVGAPDELRCDLLLLELMLKPNPDGSIPVPSGGFKLPKLQPKRLEARGDEVELRSPNSEVVAFGQKLEYDFLTGAVGVSSQKTASIQYQRHEIHAPQIYYWPEPNRRIGSFVANRAGWLRGVLPGEQAQQVEAHWTQDLRLRPDQQNPAAYVLSVRGEAHLAAVGLGSLDAGEIHAWLLEAPPEYSPAAQVAATMQIAAATGAPLPTPPVSPNSPALRLVPDKLRATNNVHVESPRLVTHANLLELWFENLPVTAPALPEGGPALGPIAALPTGPVQGAGNPPQAASTARDQAATNPATDAPASRLQVRGDTLKAKVLVRGTQTQLSNLVLAGNVRLDEIDRRDTTQPPVLIEANHLHVDQSDPAHGHVTITGEPAHVKARGLVLDGAQIHLEQQSDHLWVDGAGHMVLPVDRDLQGQPAAVQQMLDLLWAGRMDFNGQEAQFERDVIAQLSGQTLRTANLRVHLDAPLDFENPGSSRPNLDWLQCAGGVEMENRTFNGNQPTSIAKLSLVDLHLEQRTGELQGAGPGGLSVVRLGGDDAAARLPGANGLPILGPPPGAPPGSAGLSYLGVRFQGKMTGNLQRRTTTFHEQVRVAYGPVARWDESLDPDNPGPLRPRDILLNCQQLTATQVDSPTGGERSFELEATGNPFVEGQQFTARGQRLAYVEAKDILVLAGSGRQLAELNVQRQPGAPPQHLTAAQIRFQPSTNKVDIDGASFLDLSTPPRPPR